jgi:hypothetical protein
LPDDFVVVRHSCGLCGHVFGPPGGRFPAPIRRIPRMLASVPYALNKYITQDDGPRDSYRCVTMRL